MTQHPGYPPYGAPPGGTQYGPPHGYGPPPHSPSIPQAPPPRQKSSLPLILGIAGAAIVVIGGGAVAAILVLKGKSNALPVEARLLPSSTMEIGKQLIEASREPDERVKQAYLSAELGAEMCRAGGRDPARRLEELPTGTSRAAKEFFFDKKQIDDTQSLLECGALLAGTRTDDYQSVVSFGDEDRSKMNQVAIGHFTFTEIPLKFGFTKYSYDGIQGFCRTQAEDTTTPLGQPVAAQNNACGETNHGAFNQNTAWFLGKRTALEEMAKSVKRPKEELNARISALKDAATHTQGLPVVRLTASPKSSKDFFMSPCYFGAWHSAAPLTEFVEGCFPAKNVERQLSEIDSKIKAAAYETDGDPQKAGAFEGNLIFVARDTDGGKDIEKEVKDIVGEWKTQVDTNEAKLINKSREAAYSTRTKKFAAVADTYFKALKTATVTRDGRVVRVHYKGALSEEDKRGLDDADKQTVENRRAVASILEAVQGKKPIPEAPLAKLVGPAWAKYLIGPVPAAYSSTPLPKKLMPTDQCKALQKKIAAFNVSSFGTTEAKVMYLTHKTSNCSVSPPLVDDVQLLCLASFTNAFEYQKCAALGSGTPANEPPESDFGDHAAKKK
jgi:hypothetical protein